MLPCVRGASSDQPFTERGTGRGPGDRPVLRRLAAISWFLIYLLDAPLVLIALWLQLRVPGGDWAWPLTPLAAQAFAAWCIAMAGLLAMVAREADWDRVFPASARLLLFSALQLVAMARYAQTPQGPLALPANACGPVLPVGAPVHIHTGE